MQLKNYWLSVLGRDYPIDRMAYHLNEVITAAGLPDVYFITVKGLRDGLFFDYTRTLDERF
jgi:hypothetical protein